MSLNPLIEFFPRDRMFHCELSQTLPFLWEVLQSHVSKKWKCVYSLCYGRCRKRSGNTRVQRESLMTSQEYKQMAGVKQEVAERRTRNVPPYQLSLWYPLQSLENKTQRRLRQILPKKKKTRQVVRETKTGKCLAVGTLHSPMHFCNFISSCCCFSCTLCVAELNDHMEHTERKKTLRIIMFQKVKPKRTTW